MAYSKQGFKSKDTLYATQLNNMDEQIAENEKNILESKNTLAKIKYRATPQKYGAKGDGTTDDTAAFQAALAAERVVFVPGGTYKLSSGIVIGANSMLELSQDTVLVFTNTTGYCINLDMSATLKGNHATVKVPYWFEGSVLYAYSCDRTEIEQRQIPPWTLWDPQWKTARYITDINICKDDSSQGEDRGYHYAVNPTDCRGTAVYIEADKTTGMSSYMWSNHFSGIRIAGAFSYGIRAVTKDGGYLNDMRIEAAYIDACEIGVSLEECNNVYVSASIQPRRAYTLDKVYKPYAKHGVQLIRSKNVDLSGSRVWDWNETYSLWADGGEYQHISMIGDCRGTIISDFAYHTTSYDIRDRIYTDSEINLDTMIVIQEPITKWFMVQDGEPYYNAGLYKARLITQKELDKHFDTDFVKSFTDLLPTAKDSDGSVYNGIGYKRMTRIEADGSEVESGYYFATGYIPCKAGSEIYAHDMSFAKGDDNCRVLFYDKDFNLLRYGGDSGEQYPMLVNRGLLINNKNTFIVANYTELDDGFKMTLNGGQYNPHTTKGTAYFRLVIYKSQWGEAPMIAVDEPIEYTVEGFLADGIKVKGENIIGIPGQVTPDWVATKEESGGDAIVISEQTLTSGMWSGRQMDIEPGISYDVYINDKRYTCEAFNEDGGICLGNNSAMTLNDYPFSIIWFGGTATGGMFIEDDSLTYPLNLKVTSGTIVVYNKMPKEYLPDEVALKSDIADVKIDEDALNEMLKEVLS